MSCTNCNSNRICHAGGKCSDCFGATIGENSHDGYVPNDLGIGGGDYMNISFCMDCGKIQGQFPLPQSKLESINVNDS